jgi:membrane fusion protein (multidrug efflux system)
MVDGFQKLRGDALVKPVAWQPAASAAQAPSASAAASAR